MSNRQAWTDFVEQGQKREAKPPKYRNQPVTTATQHFPSKHEAKAIAELEAREHLGEIEKLTRQVEFDLVVNGVLICKYRADAIYWQKGQRVVVDAKGKRTREYAIKRKLMLAVHGIEILEV